MYSIDRACDLDLKTGGMDRSTDTYLAFYVYGAKVQSDDLMSSPLIVDVYPSISLILRFGGSINMTSNRGRVVNILTFCSLDFRGERKRNLAERK